jgi:hypothetical protein
MKTSGIFCFLIILLAFLSGTNLKLSAQVNQYSMMAGLGPFPGYVILASGDTLKGTVNWAMKYIENNPYQLKFTAENGNAKSFSAGEIKGCGITMMDSQYALPMPPEHYVALPSLKKGEPVFIRRLMDGRLTVYQNRSAAITDNSVTQETSTFDGIAFSFTLADGLSIGPSYRTEYRIIKERSHASSYYVVKDSAAMIKIEKGNYESLFKSIFGDCEAIDKELTKNPDLSKFKNFMLLAEVYNKICN